eukprot:4492360-Lingulodinium_polyedra.AAC.1
MRHPLGRIPIATYIRQAARQVACARRVIQRARPRQLVAGDQRAFQVEEQISLENKFNSTPDCQDNAP